MKKRVIAYLHSHWDREWYREFEIFRMRLLRVFDEILEALNKNLIPSFYFDGQVVALLDYLKIRPEKEENIRELIKKKKLFIGPFYCLIDEFLTSETLFRKNLEYGLNIAQEFGCTDFTGYLPDTFGHSAGVIKILKDYKINECLVWRGCKDLPSEFIWQDENGTEINAINLIRGYFMDIFSADLGIEKKAEFLKNNLDKIARKSSNTLLLPIGADHLGIQKNIQDQIDSVNEYLDEYHIELGSVFDYINAIKNNYKTKFQGELRDNTLTFTLEGSYSSRADLKRLNIICSHELSRAEKLVNFYNSNVKYDKLLEYSYKLLLQNQAHDSICGCSTDDTHQENLIRYKKILQITRTIISEIKFRKKLSGKIVNLSNKSFSGVIKLEKYKPLKSDIKYKKRKGFPDYLLNDTNRIPITEDHQNIYTILEYVQDVPSANENKILPAQYTPIKATDKQIKGLVEIKVGKSINFSSNNKNVKIVLKDFKDNGDSYNRGPVKNDKGEVINILSSKLKFSSPLRCTLEVKYENNIKLELSLDANSLYPKFKYIINNKKKNHHLLMCLELDKDINETYSEDMNRIIKRNFNPNYDIRKNLPTQRGKEAQTNTAPCQRLVFANGIGAVLKGITQYEVFKKELRLSLLRSTGVISNPNNSSRTTPAGPPIETPDLQLIKTIEQEVWLFFGNKNELQKPINQIYNYIYT